MLKSIHIKNYKLFEDLKVSNLRRVNLISGKNNVGKTAFVEALRILEGEGEKSVLESIIKKRGDDNQTSKDEFASLFFNKKINTPIRINDLVIGYRLNKEGDKYQIAKTLSKEKDNYKLIESFTRFSYGNSINPNDKAVFIPASIDFDNSQLWDNISLTSEEEDVIEALQLVIPDVDRVNITARDRKVKIRTKSIGKPIPLKNYGDGTNRIFTIALAMVNARGKILLIDEFETGLHYSLQRKLWDFVFRLAKKFNVQVFATTHSWDCIDAFAEVSSKKENNGEGKYFRLEKKDKIVAVEYTQEELETATEKRIETR